MEPINNFTHMGAPLYAGQESRPAGRPCPSKPPESAGERDRDQLVLACRHSMPDAEFAQALSRGLSERIRQEAVSPSPPEKLDRLRRQLQNGSYSPDPQLIAQRLLELSALSGGED